MRPKDWRARPIMSGIPADRRIWGRERVQTRRARMTISLDHSVTPPDTKCDNGKTRPHETDYGPAERWCGRLITIGGEEVQLLFGEKQDHGTLRKNLHREPKATVDKDYRRRM